MNGLPDSPSALVQQFFANVVSGYLAVAGAGLFLAGSFLFFRRARVWFTGERADGEVIGYEPRMKLARAEVVSHMPRVRFTTSGGEVREFQSRTSVRQSPWAVGSTVPVRYCADRPEQAEIAAPLQYWAAPAGLLVFGFVLLCAALRAAS